jgi:hypothetical protein
LCVGQSQPQEDDCHSALIPLDPNSKRQRSIALHVALRHVGKYPLLKVQTRAHSRWLAIAALISISYTDPLPVLRVLHESRCLHDGDGIWAELLLRLAKCYVHFMMTTTSPKLQGQAVSKLSRLLTKRQSAHHGRLLLITSIRGLRFVVFTRDLSTTPRLISC